MGESTTEASRFEQHRYVPPPDSVEIVVVRHGASEAALPGKSFPLIDGQGDPALSEVGRAQARLGGGGAGRRDVLRRLRLQPAADAGNRGAAAGRLGLKPTVLPDLREVFLGELEGGGTGSRSPKATPSSPRSPRGNAGT